jgi:hypothetical protein
LRDGKNSARFTHLLNELPRCIGRFALPAVERLIVLRRRPRLRCGGLRRKVHGKFKYHDNN